MFRLFCFFSGKISYFQITLSSKKSFLKSIQIVRLTTVWHEIFCGNYFLRISNFFGFAELIFAISTARFFALGINFQNVQDQAKGSCQDGIDKIFVFIERVQWTYIFSAESVPYVIPVKQITFLCHSIANIEQTRILTCIFE